MEFELHKLYTYQEFYTGKILNSFQIKAVGEGDEVYRFQVGSHDSKVFLNIHKDDFPIHIESITDSITRKITIKRV